jgi:hypothetical protein
MGVRFADITYIRIIHYIEGSIGFGALDWSVNKKIISYGNTLFSVYSPLGQAS